MFSLSILHSLSTVFNNFICVCIILRIGKHDFTSVDPFYLQQANFLLNDMFENGIMAEIKEFFVQGCQETLSDLSKLFLTRKKATEIAKARMNSKSKSPTRVRVRGGETRPKRAASIKERLDQRSPSPGRQLNQQEAKQFRSGSLGRNNEEENADEQFVDSDAFELDEQDLDEIYQSRKEMRHNHLNKKFSQSMPQNGKGSLNAKFFYDSTLQSSVIYYATSENNLNGIIFCLKQFGINSHLFSRIYFHFIQSCLKIQLLFKSNFLQVNQHIYPLKKLFALVINIYVVVLRLSRQL